MTGADANDGSRPHDPPPAPGRRLLCDEMLAGLARWLRAAGHDTALAERGEPDDALLARAFAERRTLLTRDTALAAASPTGVRLAAERLDAQAAELANALHLDWTAAPFTRCLIDNTPLRPAAEAERAAAPEGARSLAGPFRACPHCGRVYWPGSHVRRMAARLEGWARGG